MAVAGMGGTPEAAGEGATEVVARVAAVPVAMVDVLAGVGGSVASLGG